MRFMELVIARVCERFALFTFVSMRQIFSANSASNFLDSALFCVESSAVFGLLCQKFSCCGGGDFDLNQFELAKTLYDNSKSILQIALSFVPDSALFDKFPSFALIKFTFKNANYNEIFSILQ